MVIVDPNGIIRVANSQAERMLGYEAGELVGKPIELLIPAALRERHVQHRTGYNEHPTTRRMGVGLDLAALRKDGSIVPAEISLRSMETPEGRFVVSAIRDVTERREAEELLRHQTEALERSNEALQQFAYVASHDLQEPLRMVSSYLQLLDRRYRDELDDDAREFIGYAVDGAKRMSALIQDLLAYARVGRADVAYVKVLLGEVVARVLHDLDPSIREAEAIVTVGPLPTIVGDAGQLGQLYQNLVGNALTEYPGTGIGLAICKRIVEYHGGTLGVASSPDAGATFTFTLPDGRRRAWAT